jgi:hypothetical protein
MALIDEEKLQGRVFNILEVLRKDIDCCKVVSTTWANSSEIGAGVFITIDQKGNITVYDVPGGSILTPAEYGTLTKP